MKKEKKIEKSKIKSFPPQKEEKFWRYLPIGSYFVLTIILFAGFIFSGKMLYGTDTMGAGVFFRSFYADFWRTYHTMPLWEPFVHGGMPFVDAMHGDIFYPAAILQFFIKVTYALGLKLVLHVFLAGVFMFYFLRGLNLRRDISFLGGLLYMFSPGLVSLVYPGHDGKMYVYALLPLAFMLLHKACKTGRFLYFLLFSLSFALLVFTAHMQMTYFAAWGLGLYFLYQLWNIRREGNRKIIKYITYFVIAIILGISLSMIQLLSPYIYLKNYSMRTMHTEAQSGYDYASSWSMHLEEAASEIVPEFSGDNIHTQGNFYWGRNPFKLNSEYIGLLALFLAVVTIIYRRTSLIWFFTGLGILAFIYALGGTTPFFRLFYYLVPGVKSFRGPGMINFLFCFAAVVIAMLGLDNFLKLKENLPEAKRFLKTAFILVIVYSGLAILVSLLRGTFFDIWIAILYSGIDSAKKAAMEQNVPRVITGLWISTFLLWLGYGILRLYIKGGVKTSLLIGGLSVIALVDLFRVDSRFIITVDPDQFFRKTPVVDFLQARQKEEPFRAFLLPQSYPDNYLAMFGIEEVSLTAMHGNQLRIYDEFVGRHQNSPNLTYPNFMNLLNIKYLLSSQILKTPWAQQVYEAEGIYVYQNLNYLPRGFPVYNWQVIKDQSRILETLKQPDFDAREKIFLDEAPPKIPSDTLTAASAPVIPARVSDDKINRFNVDVEMQKDGFLVLSENYYPAWKAYVDGQEAKIYKADYLFRAVYLDKGRHTLRLVYDSKAYNIAKAWTLLTCVMMLVILVFYAIRSYLVKTKVETTGTTKHT
jgi:uncharacterized membrane protein YidH (DUF202 family)